MAELREKLEGMDPRFALVGIKMYFVHEPVEGLKGKSLVYASKNNIAVETLKAGTLGLPTAAEPVHHVEIDSGPRYSFPTNPPPDKDEEVNQSDKNDLDFLVYWLDSNDMKIDFDLYLGKEKPELLKLVRAYRHKLGDDAELLEALKGALQEEDWEAIQIPPEESTAESTLAPPE